MPGNPTRSLCIDGRIIYVNIILNGYSGLHLTENVDGWRAVVDEESGRLKTRNCLTSWTTVSFFEATLFIGISRFERTRCVGRRKGNSLSLSYFNLLKPSGFFTCQQF
jgi:hypothetical protein